MPRYLYTKGRASVAIAICDRCREKHPIGDLRSDINSPGLRVCRECCDRIDPYRLPARRTEKIDLRYPRPDEELIVGPDPSLIGDVLRLDGVPLYFNGNYLYVNP